MIWLVLFFLGSSPRLWGTHLYVKNSSNSSRFIPTAVGNADWRRLLGPRPAVHPHGCGERIASCMANSAKCGSSPRLWGTLLFQALVMRLERFIPTAVGNAVGTLACGNIGSVHPHGCGERLDSGIIGDISRGSSPRLWGTRLY